MEKLDSIELTRLIALFGLQHPSQVIAFLKTHEGVRLKEMIFEKLMQKEVEFIQLINSLAETRYWVNYFNSLSEEKRAEKKALNQEETEKQKEQLEAIQKGFQEKTLDKAQEEALNKFREELYHASKDVRDHEKKYEKETTLLTDFFNLFEGSSEEDLMEELGKTKTKAEDIQEKILKQADEGDFQAEARGSIEMTAYEQAILHELLDTTSRYYDKDGIQVSTVKDAHYIVPKGKELKKSDDKFYLLKEGEAISDKAHEEYLRRKAQILSVKALRHENYKNKKDDLEMKVFKTLKLIPTGMEHLKEVKKGAQATVKRHGFFSHSKSPAKVHPVDEEALSKDRNKRGEGG